MKIDMIGLFVENLESMVRFYNEVIGMSCTWDGVGPYAEFTHENVRFAMYERAQLPELLGSVPGYPRGLNGTFELAFNVGAPEQVDIVYQKILEGGGSSVYAPRNEPWHMRSAMIADPEGNLLEIASAFWS